MCIPCTVGFAVAGGGGVRRLIRENGDSFFRDPSDLGPVAKMSAGGEIFFAGKEHTIGVLGKQQVVARVIFDQ